jgi:hypothetical protein
VQILGRKEELERLADAKAADDGGPISPPQKGEAPPRSLAGKRGCIHEDGETPSNTGEVSLVDDRLAELGQEAAEVSTFVEVYMRRRSGRL